MKEQVINTNMITTVGELRRAMATLPDDMPVRDGGKRLGLAVSLIRIDHDEVLEVS